MTRQIDIRMGPKDKLPQEKIEHAVDFLCTVVADAGGKAQLIITIQNKRRVK